MFSSFISIHACFIYHSIEQKKIEIIFNDIDTLTVIDLIICERKV